MMQGSKEKPEEKSETAKVKKQKTSDNRHLGSSNAFEETENPLSWFAEDISDEKLDEILGEK